LYLGQRLTVKGLLFSYPVKEPSRTEWL